MLNNRLAIDTNLWRYMPRAIAEQMFTLMPMKTVTQGISTVLVAALDPKLSGKKTRSGSQDQC